MDYALADDAFRRRCIVSIEDDVGWRRRHHHRDLLRSPSLTWTRLFIGKHRTIIKRVSLHEFQSSQKEKGKGEGKGKGKDKGKDKDRKHQCQSSFKAVHN